MEAATLLREVRRRHGLTQRQLAARARTSQAAISRIERGLVSPSVETLARLLDLMGEELRLDAEPIDYGHDRTLFESEAVVTAPEQRIRNHGELVERRLAARRDDAGPSFELDPLLLGRSPAASVDFVLVGGVAGAAHGSAYRTNDVEIAVRGEIAANLERLAAR